MTLRLIGAGLPRTGTSTLREALRHPILTTLWRVTSGAWLQVRAGTGPERLIEWQPADGWGPICRALGVPVPDLPFPHENTTADFLARAEARACET